MQIARKTEEIRLTARRGIKPTQRTPLHIVGWPEEPTEPQESVASLCEPAVNRG